MSDAHKMAEIFTRLGRERILIDTIKHTLIEFEQQERAYALGRPVKKLKRDTVKTFIKRMIEDVADVREAFEL